MEKVDQQELLNTASTAQMANYRPPAFVLSRGQGRHVWDVEGKRYLDLTGGIAVLCAGHSHPTMVQALTEQASRLMHTSNMFYNDRGIELAAEITRRTAFDRVYFANSGAEANEALLKIARKWQFLHGAPERTKIISTHGSFHGRTMGALSVTGQPAYRKGMEPLVGDITFVGFNDLAAMEAAVDSKTAAVLVEPIQGEGGLTVAGDAYLQGLRKLCDDRGALLLFDEVQTGYGRTGRFLAQEWSGVTPDACALAKGMGGGFPLGALAVTEKLADGLPPGSHGSTYGGNPLACAAGLAVLRIMDGEDLIARAETTGQYLSARLHSMKEQQGISAIEEVRGRGLMVGAKLKESIPVLQVLVALRDKGVLLTRAGHNVLRFVPPLNTLPEEIDEALLAVKEVLTHAPTS